MCMTKILCYLLYQLAMYSNIGRALTMKKSTVVVLGSLLLVVHFTSATEGSFEDLENTKDSVADGRKFKQLWDIYLLPRLEHSLRSKELGVESDSNEETGLNGLPSFQTAYYPRILQRSRMKRGRGIAGLDNMDILLKTLDLNRGRPMTVSDMSNNRLRNLMALQGRRRK